MSFNALIIDDDELFLCVAEAALKDCGAKVILKAIDGTQALEIIDRNDTQFDLIVCDLEMPEMDGIMTIRELAKRDTRSKIIIVSSMERPLREAVAKMGKLINGKVIGSLSKPLEVEKMLHLISAPEDSFSPSTEPIDKERLLYALDTRSLRPFYQPKIDAKSLRVTGFEVLCRHINDDGQIGVPIPFIQAALKFGLIDRLTRSIIDHVVEDTTKWKNEFGPFELSININPASMLNADLPDEISCLFKSAGIDPSAITLEITEDKLLEEDPIILEVLSRLRLFGFKLSLDDFGTGAASIEQLTRFPFHELKVDRKFVGNAIEDRFSNFTVEAAVKLAAMQGMSVVAEGVETKETFSLMQTLGVSSVQGFLFSQALPPEKVCAWVRSYNLVALNAA